MKEKMLQILENSSMGEKEAKAVYSEILNLFSVSDWFFCDDEDPRENHERDLVIVKEVDGPAYVHRPISNGFPVDNYYWKVLKLPNKK